MTTVAGGNDSVIPISDWHGILGDAATEVFSMMVGTAVTRPEAQDISQSGNVTAAVGIAGALRAMFTLRCSTESATKMASSMLGVAVEEAGPHLRDAVGEICNIVAGHFKAKVGLGDKCVLAVPTVITGSNYRLLSPTGSLRLEMALMYEGDPVWVALEIRR